MTIRHKDGNFRLEEFRKRCIFNSLSIDDYFWELFNYQEKLFLEMKESIASKIKRNIMIIFGFILM